MCDGLESLGATSPQSRLQRCRFVNDGSQPRVRRVQRRLAPQRQSCLASGSEPRLSDKARHLRKPVGPFGNRVAALVKDRQRDVRASVAQEVQGLGGRFDA